MGRAARAVLRRLARMLPPGARSLAGVVLVIGGFFGFLPVLGFWMIPLGLGLIALDIRPAWRRWRRWRARRQGRSDDGPPAAR
ncbi:MAG: hypothetical protein D6832_06345 [Alphaproteobacteria bacterium]|nr:MAG: hypothetical protein D6832_06345 [Alphaproteobacteria bacterium]